MGKASLVQAGRLIQLVADTGWSAEEVNRRIIERFGLLRDIAVALDDPRLTEENMRAMHPLFYNKRMTFDSLLCACRQHRVSLDFDEENFPLEPATDDEDEWEVVEHHFRDGICGNVAFEEFEAMAPLGYRLCGPRRAMQFIATHPDLQLDHPLTVTTRWRPPKVTYWLAPVFSQRGGGRDLRLVNLSRDISSDYGWLVLHKRPV